VIRYCLKKGECRVSIRVVCRVNKRTATKISDDKKYFSNNIGVMHVIFIIYILYFTTCYNFSYKTILTSGKNRTGQETAMLDLRIR